MNGGVHHRFVNQAVNMFNSSVKLDIWKCPLKTDSLLSSCHSRNYNCCLVWQLIVAFLCGVCTFPISVCFSLGTPASFHSPKTCKLSGDPWMVVCLYVSDLSRLQHFPLRQCQLGSAPALHNHGEDKKLWKMEQIYCYKHINMFP